MNKSKMHDETKKKKVDAPDQIHLFCLLCCHKGTSWLPPKPGGPEHSGGESPSLAMFLMWYISVLLTNWLLR